MKQKQQIKDSVGIIYEFFLIFMCLTQLFFIIYNFTVENYVFVGLNVIILIYFTFRLYIFIQMKALAHKSGRTILEYLDEIKRPQ